MSCSHIKHLSKIFLHSHHIVFFVIVMGEFRKSAVGNLLLYYSKTILLCLHSGSECKYEDSLSPHHILS